ncbi:NAD-dependent epimerase/dehydratase family protein [Streptomyces bobili]|uniref:NAD-dependent epimerase/dehydratase family protein n=1 Tax=Streptomyces bobili TaxID=67280 RepID=UPI00341ABCA7
MYLIVGAGVIGSTAACLLANSGIRVRLVTRHGSGPDHPAVERVAADATDTSRLVELAHGATKLFNCAMPPYDRWPAEWPPLAASILTAAERVGADYIMLGNTYGYAPVEGRVTPDLAMAPVSKKGAVRAQMWHAALASHDAGRVRVTEVRATDYLGAAANSPFTMMVGTPVLAGSPVWYPGDLDAPHSWSYTVDVARTLIAAAENDRSWGRAWHVPAVSEAPVRELATLLADAAGKPAPQLHHMTVERLQDLGRENSVMAEFPEMLYLYNRRNLLDYSETVKTLRVTPTSLETVLAEMAEAHVQAST